MSWIIFGLGVMVGGAIGVVTMCFCLVSGEESRHEEQREQKQC